VYDPNICLNKKLIQRNKILNRNKLTKRKRKRRSTRMSRTVSTCLNSSCTGDSRLLNSSCTGDSRLLNSSCTGDSRLLDRIIKIIIMQTSILRPKCKLNISGQFESWIGLSESITVEPAGTFLEGGVGLGG